jgi:chromatin segregation and condensation protein Rec8/ScpA/Scc1 (kleisin family)
MDQVYGHRSAPVVPDGPEPRRREAVSVFDLIQAVSIILKRFNERDDVREIQADPHTVSEKMAALRILIEERGRFRFSELFAQARSRSEVVVTFLAMLELTRLRHLRVTQGEDFGEIEVEAAPPEAPVDVVPEEPVAEAPEAPVAPGSIEARGIQPEGEAPSPSA